MSDGEGPEQLRAVMRERLGALMRNPVRKQGLTCAVCLAPLAPRGYDTCWECHQQRGSGWTLADRVIALAYSIDGQQSNLDMHRYKDPMSEARRVASEAWQRLSLLVAGFALWHSPCLDRVARVAVSGLVTVPSLRGRVGTHPLNGLAAHLPRAWQRIPLLPATHTDRADDRRSLNPAHFALPESAALAGRHVVVLEDTWVRGGHAQSAAAALRDAGARETTVVTLARRLSPSYGPSRTFLADWLHEGREYSVDICPVTGDTCPR